MPASEASTATTATATAAPTTTAPAGGAGDFLSALPQWLQPGVSPGVHMILRVTLGMLNLLLLYCAAARVFSPHFEIMFLLSLGLTGSYAVFMMQLESLRVEAETERAERAKREAAARAAARKKAAAKSGAAGATEQPAAADGAARETATGGSVVTDTSRAAGGDADDGDAAESTGAAQQRTESADDCASESTVQTETVVDAQEKKDQ